MQNPEFVRINGKEYKINTDYRVAIRCSEIADDTSIDDYERGLAIIYLLYGDEGLDNSQDHNKLLELAIRFISCDENLEKGKDEKKDMDLNQDMKLIKASFKTDYSITLDDNTYMHWWDFYMYLNGLKEDCILNRVRQLRDIDVKKIKDKKEQERIIREQKKFALKEKENKITKEQEASMQKLNKLIGL